ncbi:MAG TPA: AMMECR1 domain-containing protein [Terriglobales bacterium]|nr:AMMECR1 domain-containing protein [Terriglobales bacterium]
MTAPRLHHSAPGWHKLRGCVGYVFPVRPLYRTVVETAVAAALNDPRFLPERCPDARGETCQGRAGGA